MAFNMYPNRNNLAIVGLVLIVVTFLSVNIFSNSVFRSTQVDLTEDKLFTLSDGTRQVLEAVKEQIKIRFYFSKLLGQKAPVYNTYAQRVKELLERYVEIAKGKVQLEVYNPEPFSDVEDRAMTYGLKGGRLNDAGDMGYFGVIASNSVDDEQTIAFFDPERSAFLEYDLTKMIHTLANPKKKILGVISTLPVGGAPPQPFARRQAPDWPIMTSIGEFFEIRNFVPTVKSIAKDVDVLMIIHPHDLSQDTLFAIDQFVLGGGRALVFADGLNEVEAMGQRGPFVTMPSKFDKLLNAWGLTMENGKVAGDLDAATRVSASHQTGTNTVTDYVAWLNLGPTNFNQSDIVTADMSNVRFASSAIFNQVDGATTQIQPLITTGLRSMPVGLKKVQTGPDVLGILREFKPSGKKLMLAARITGPAKSAFPDGPPTPATQAAGDAKPAESAKPLADAQNINVIVVGDADMLHQRFWARVQNVFGQQVLVPIANNANFVINALDNLSGSSALLKLRARGQSSRPFTLVAELQRSAELQFRSKEDELQKKMAEAQEKLNKLLGRERAPGEIKLSSDENKQINAFRRELVSVRRELRGVQHDLRKDIDALDALLKFLNIAAIPLLLAVATILYAIVRRGRRTRQQMLH